MTAANTPDAMVFEALLDDIPKVRTPAGGRRCRPDKCHADKAYDNRRCRSYLTRRGIRVRIARRHPLRPRLRALLRVRHAGLRPAVLQPPARHSRSERTVTLTEVPECPLIPSALHYSHSRSTVEGIDRLAVQQPHPITTEAP